MTFLNDMKYENNKTYNAKGENAYNSTLDPVLDYFTGASSHRYDMSDSIIDIFVDALKSDKVLAMKSLFYSRDITEGMGEKRVPIVIFEYLAKNEPDLFRRVVKLIPEYGSFNDLRKIIGSDKLTYEEVLPVLEFLDSTLKRDEYLYSQNSDVRISLCAKWMPSMGNRSKLHKIGLSRFLRYTNLTTNPKKYRKMISKLRKHLEILETKLTEFRYEDIEYSKLPSQAFKKYTQAFYRNDGETFQSFLDRVNSGEDTVNSGTIHTHQLVGKYIEDIPPFAFMRHPSHTQKDDAIEAQWKNLPKLNTEDRASVLTMVDVSGSMFNGLSINVAVSLGIYMAENSSGDFKDHIMSFSDNPMLIELDRNDSLFNRTKKILSEDVGYTTDLEKAFNLVLDTAVSNNSKQDDLPEVIIALTDMQMDQAMRYDSIALNDDKVDPNFLYKMKKQFEYHGYELPYVIWWDTSISHGRKLPVTKFDDNTAIISGFSQSLFNIIFNLDLDELENMTPLSFMMSALNSERYDAVEEELSSDSNK